MKKILIVLLLISPVIWAGHNHKDDVQTHSDEGHFHAEVDGQKLEVNSERFDKFIEGLSDAKVVMVSVKGLVCDFCARGIEKTFKKDKDVKKIDVDLDRGKVIIAYTKNKEIDFEEIKKQILANGQNATDLQILEI